MQRRAILQKLAAYRPCDTDQQRLRDEIAEFVASHVDCFERTLQVGHITGAAWVVDGRGSRVLLTHHRKLGKWLHLGGHCDGDADVLRVAIREAVEESGIDDIEPLSDQIFDVDVHPIPRRGDVARHIHYDIRFLLRVTRDVPFTVSSESLDLAWIAPEELRELVTDSSVIRMNDKWMALRGS